MKQTGKTDKRGKRIFYILMFIVFFWFIAAQLLGNSEQSSGMSQADYVYQGQILWEKPDGGSEPITIPGKYDVAENETMVRAYFATSGNLQRTEPDDTFFPSGYPVLCGWKTPDRI